MRFDEDLSPAPLLEVARCGAAESSLPHLPDITRCAASATASFSDRFKEWIRGFSFPISIPQFAPVVMMLMFAFLVFSQTVSADGSLSDIYAKSFQLAEQTYEQR